METTNNNTMDINTNNEINIVSNAILEDNNIVIDTKNLKSINVINNVTMKFSDSNTINFPYDNDTTLLSLIGKAIIHTNDALSDVDINFIPEKYLNRFKIVYRGKIVKTTKNIKVVEVIDTTHNTILHCVFPQLQKSDINEIKALMSVPIETINELLTSSQLIELLKKPSNYKFLKNYIDKNGNISNENILAVDIDTDLSQKNTKLKKVINKITATKTDTATETETNMTTQENNINSPTIQPEIPIEILYSLQINEIVNMGFEYNDTIKQLLKRYNGDVQNVLNHLLG